jgi:hypothetical protein
MAYRKTRVVDPALDQWHQWGVWSEEADGEKEDEIVAYGLREEDAEHLASAWTAEPWRAPDHAQVVRDPWAVA